jgi:IMP dehydrogenase
MREAFTFDDVLIIPSHSDIDSRSEISLAQNFLGLEMGLPIISANMDYVTGATMSYEMRQNGALGILHRFYPDKESYLRDIFVLGQLHSPIIISVGTRDIKESMISIRNLYLDNKDMVGVCIDIAHGDHKKVVDLINLIKIEFPDLSVIAGNVATGEGFQRLVTAGADAIKVGIGPGSVCTTREVTGVGVPQLSSIMDVYETKMAWGYYATPIIADGGIKNSGDIVKALAAGADLVMLGSLLAGSPECPGSVRVAPDNSRWRPYRGQSIFGVNGAKFVPEGISGWVQEKPPVAQTLAKLAGGIRSGMSYVGARNLPELRENAEFIKISHSTHYESGTRVATQLE